MAGKVRQPIDLAALDRYLAANVPEASLPVELSQFGFGQSNPTYLLTDRAGRRFVLRKKPPGRLVSSTAHNVGREHRILAALAPTPVPVPAVFALCDDPAVLGTDFYIMDFLDGRIFEDPALPGLAPADRTALWQEAIRVLGALHRLDPAEVGLDRFGRHGNFYARQLKTFAAISDAQAKVRDADTGKPVGPIPHYDQVVRYFGANQPRDRVSLVHGDYKIDNLVYHKTEPRIIGVLDWEMSTIGHPLSDLANLLHPFLTAAIPEATRSGVGSKDFLPGVVPGLPTRQDCIRWYSDAAGWDPAPDILWGEAFALYRISVIMQGIAARQAVRQASSEKALQYVAMMEPFGQLAWEMVQKVQQADSKDNSRL